MPGTHPSILFHLWRCGGNADWHIVLLVIPAHNNLTNMSYIIAGKNEHKITQGIDA